MIPPVIFFVSASSVLISQERKIPIRHFSIPSEKVILLAHGFTPPFQSTMIYKNAI